MGSGRVAPTLRIERLSSPWRSAQLRPVLPSTALHSRSPRSTRSMPGSRRSSRCTAWASGPAGRGPRSAPAAARRTTRAAGPPPGARGAAGSRGPRRAGRSGSGASPARPRPPGRRGPAGRATGWSAPGAQPMQPVDHRFFALGLPGPAGSAGRDRGADGRAGQDGGALGGCGGERDQAQETRAVPRPACDRGRSIRPGASSSGGRSVEPRRHLHAADEGAVSMPPKVGASVRRLGVADAGSTWSRPETERIMRQRQRRG